MTAEQVPPPWVRIVGGHTLIGGGASVQLGAVCRVEVDFAINAVPGEAAERWVLANRRCFSEAQVKQLTADFTSGCCAQGILGALGFVLGGGDYNRHQQAQDVVLQAASRAQADFVEALRTLSNQPMRLTSDIEVYGTSLVPSVAGVFARIVQLRFADGASSNFADLSEPVAADSSGNVAAVRAGRGHRLRMVPDH